MLRVGWSVEIIAELREACLVGVILSAFGLDPFDIVHSIQRMIRTLWDLGFDAFRWLWRYFLLGAVIVIPVWILMRMFNAPRGR